MRSVDVALFVLSLAMLGLGLQYKDTLLVLMGSIATLGSFVLIVLNGAE